MCPSTEATDAQNSFAADVLRNLLRHIDAENRKDTISFWSHTLGPGADDVPGVHRRPRLNIVWGLVRDTRESNISPGPWSAVDEAVTLLLPHRFRGGRGRLVWPLAGRAKDDLVVRLTDGPVCREPFRHPRDLSVSAHAIDRSFIAEP